MAAFHTTAADRFDSFNVYTTSYKKIGDHGIEVNVLVPKDIKPGKHPLLVKFHGGGLVTGTAMYPDWFSAFFVPFIQRNSAIAILPNYRLMPEHTGQDILDDLADFWTWFNGSLATYVASKEPSVALDFDHVLVSGESAGGFMSIQSALTQPKGAIKAILAQYPMTHPLELSPDAKPMGFEIPPKSQLDEHLASIMPGTVLSGATPPARSGLTLMMAAYGPWSKFMGTARHLQPITAVEDAGFLPPMWIIQGKEDSIVFYRESEAFVKKAEKVPGAKVRLVARDGEHGFDVEAKLDKEPWLEETLKEVEGEWLA